MEVEITPRPAPDERRAILVALARRGRANAYESGWRRAGLDYATARPGPRSSRGAERA